MEQVKKIDNFVFGLFLLFVLTLTNSIFLCQIGYFGSLLLLLYIWAANRKTPFKKTGLELPLLLFVVAEILATLFSIDMSQAAHNLLKRLLLLPILYVTLYVASDEKKAKKIVFVFLAAALLTASVYVGASVHRYFKHLYKLETSGPSVFQYVMTAGGLISFVFVYFFAFLINEKVSTGKRLLLAVATLILFIALIGSYTRTAWLGAFVGAGVILIIKKRWLVIWSGVVLIFAYLMLNSKISLITEYELTENNLITVKEIKTSGRVHDLLTVGKSLLAADYNNGIMLLENGKIISHLKTAKPVVNIRKWQKGIYTAATMNKTIYFFSLEKNNLKLLSEYIPPYYLKGNFPIDSLLYVFGSKGEITILKNPANPKVVKKGKLNIDVTTVAAEKKFTAFFSAMEKKLFVFSNSDGLPDSTIFVADVNKEQGRFASDDSTLLFWSGDEFLAFKISNSKISKYSTPPELANVARVRLNGSYFWGLDFGRKLVEWKFEKEKMVKVKSYSLKEKANGFAFAGNNLFTFYSRKNRIASIFDPYHSTNVQRLNQWKTGWRIFKDHPIFGVGDIDLNKIYLKYRAPYETETYGHLHNIYVQILVILGAFGFIVVMYLFVTILLLEFKIYKALKDVPFASSVVLATIGVFTAFLTSGLTEWNFGDQEIATMIWFVVGLSLAFFKIFGGKNVR